MKVYEINLKLFLLKDIAYESLQTAISSFFDLILCRDEDFLKKHKENVYADYTFSGLKPLETDKIYRREHVYTVTIRTINPRLAQYFDEVVVHEHNGYLKGLSSQIKKIPNRKIIEKIWTVTPAVLKNDEGYWRNLFSLEEFQRRLTDNARKKYEYFTGEYLEEISLFTNLEFTNRKPIRVNYKKIHLLGDKLNLQVCESETAQKVAYLLLGVGLLENNSRGLGFLNYHWL